MSYALITGASQGIGKEFAKVLASNGYDLVLVARNMDRLEQVKQELESSYACKVEVFSIDLSLENSARDVYDFCVDKGIEIQCLINNAGLGDFGLFSESDWNRQYEMVQVNIVSLMQLTHLFLPNMLAKKDGKILNISSTAWLSSGPKMSVYYASKAFVTRFSSALREEVSKCNIHVTTLCPPSVKTRFQQSANMNRKKERYAIAAKEVAVKGYHGLMKNQSIVYCDMVSRIISILVRILLDSVCGKMIQYINR